MMLGAAMHMVGPGQRQGHGKLLYLSCFGRPLIHFQTAQMHVVNCFEKWVCMSFFFRAIIHCNRYISYPLFVKKDKPTPKENHVDELQTMEKDSDT